jgi:hypothetical protein
MDDLWRTFVNAIRELPYIFLVNISPVSLVSPSRPRPDFLDRITKITVWTVISRFEPMMSAIPLEIRRVFQGTPLAPELVRYAAWGSMGTSS